jgi:hypothetical protein
MIVDHGLCLLFCRHLCFVCGMLTEGNRPSVAQSVPRAMEPIECFRKHFKGFVASNTRFSLYKIVKSVHKTDFFILRSRVEGSIIFHSFGEMTSNLIHYRFCCLKMQMFK